MESLILYSVEDRNIFFAPTTDTIIEADRYIVSTNIPLEINDILITVIGDWVFSYCEGLTKMTLLNNLTAIRDWAFADCSPDLTLHIQKGSIILKMAENSWLFIKENQITI